MNTILRKHYTQLFIAGLTLTLAGLGLWKFGLLMQEKVVKVITTKEQLTSYNQNKIIYTEETAKFKTIAARTASLEAYLVKPVTIPELLSSIENVAASSQVNFSITGVQTPGEGENEKLLIDFTGKGTFTALENFLRKLVQQPYQIKITRLAINQDMAAETSVPISEPVLSPGEAPVPVAQAKPAWQASVSVEVISF